MRYKTALQKVLNGATEAINAMIADGVDEFNVRYAIQGLKLLIENIDAVWTDVEIERMVSSTKATKEGTPF